MNKNQAFLARCYYADTSGTVAERLARAIKASDLDPARHGEDIAGFIEAEQIRPADVPPDMLPELSRYFEQVRKEAEAERERERVNAAIEGTTVKLSGYAANIARGVSPSDPAMLSEAQAIVKGLSAIAAPPARRGLTVDELHDYGTGEGYPISFWNGLKIPAPGATIIGARTGGGKTSALVNVARELLEQGKRVAFVSYEMNRQELALALTLSIMAASNTDPAANFNPADESTYPGVRFTPPQSPDLMEPADDIFSDYFSSLKAHIVKHGVPAFLAEATGRVSAWIESGTLDIHDGLGDADALCEYIEGTAFDAYLVDYIQAIPPAKDAPADGYRRIGSIVDKLRGLVNRSKQTIIAGAQFNRTQGEEADNSGFDPMAEQFREAADIEQLATLALGIGWRREGPDAPKVFFWKVLKHRFNGAIRDARMLSAGHFRYYLNLRGSPWYRAEEWGRKFKPAASPRNDKRQAKDATQGASVGKPSNIARKETVSTEDILV